MLPDEEGFLHPVAELSACIGCDLCSRICPVLHPPILPKAGTRAYGAFSSDDEIRMESTSGGIFTILADWVLNRDGAVFGAAYQENFSVAHCLVTEKGELGRLRTAKYAQSDLKDTFVQVRQLLREDRYVLYSGTPCQIAGLQAYLKKPWEKLILVDVICHGVPSPKVWQHYLQYRQQTDAPDSEPECINLRSKETGWPGYSIRFTYKNGQIYHARNGQDPFLRGFVGDFYLRPSCYACPFKGIERCSDFTLADYWRIENQHPDLHDGKGTSLVFVHSEKAGRIWTRLQDQLTSQEVEPLEAVAGNPSALRASVRPLKRELFWSRYRDEDFATLIDELLQPPPSPKRNILYRFLHILKNIIHN